MKFLSKSKSAQQGITLIEVSIALIIAAVVAAASFILFQQNQRRNDAQEGAAFITQVLTETYSKVGRNGGYTGVSAATLFNAGVVPKELGTLDTTTVKAKGGNYYSTLTFAPATDTNFGYFTIVAKSQDACVSMITAALANSKVYSGSADALAQTAGKEVATPAAAATYCSTAANNLTVYSVVGS